MARKTPRTRPFILAVAALALLALLVWAFWPRPTAVDIATVSRNAMTVTIDEEARTRVRDAYIVSAPIAGRLQRVEVEPGDQVIGGRTVIARMLAAQPPVLDARTREQARAAVRAAEAALDAARANLDASQADQDLAATELTRATRLRQTGASSQAELDRARRQKRAADSAAATARASISMREAELANARAQLNEFTAREGDGEDGVQASTIPLEAPISGRVLRVMQESETTLSPGEPILELGDVSGDLEVVAELLSTDAVQVTPGDRVIIENWGGAETLDGTVERIEPWGFTKYSALGVEEQRVNTIIGFAGPAAARASLGHGYRVDVSIVTWEDEDALTLPSAALFREDGGWAVFAVREGRARRVPVKVSRNNGELAALNSSLAEGTEVVLYPGPGLADGTRVRPRETGE